MVTFRDEWSGDVPQSPRHVTGGLNRARSKKQAKQQASIESRRESRVSAFENAAPRSFSLHVCRLLDHNVCLDGANARLKNSRGYERAYRQGVGDIPGIYSGIARV